MIASRNTRRYKLRLYPTLVVEATYTDSIRAAQLHYARYSVAAESAMD